MGNIITKNKSYTHILLFRVGFNSQKEEEEKNLTYLQMGGAVQMGVVVKRRRWRNQVKKWEGGHLLHTIRLRTRIVWVELYI